MSLGRFGQRKSLLIIYAKLFLNTIINGKSQTLLSDFFEDRGGCTQAMRRRIASSFQGRRSLNFWTIQSCFLSSNLFPGASIHLLADKPMVITEPTVPSEQQHTLSNIDFRCSLIAGSFSRTAPGAHTHQA